MWSIKPNGPINEISQKNRWVNRPNWGQLNWARKEATTNIPPGCPIQTPFAFAPPPSFLPISPSTLSSCAIRQHPSPDVDVSQQKPSDPKARPQWLYHKPCLNAVHSISESPKLRRGLLTWGGNMHQIRCQSFFLSACPCYWQRAANLHFSAMLRKGFSLKLRPDVGSQASRNTISP